MSCDPANPRRLQVSGPASGKLATEDSTGAGDQAPVLVNATGNKVLVQQAFHPGLFITRPRSASVGCSSKGVVGNSDKMERDKESKTGEIASQSKDSPTPPPWQRVPTNRNKKRKLSSTPPLEETLTSNRFVGLPIDQIDDIPVKPIKPPPIILYGVEDLNKLTELLETTTEKHQFTYKIINKNQLRISTIDADVHKKLITLIRSNGLIGHTFNRKDNRDYRIVIKNLHPSTPLNIIKEELEATGNQVTGEIINARYGPEKRPTSTFFANLAAGPNNKSIKDLKYIYHQSITIEEPKKRKTIAQCQRCQQYGHTKNYCMRPFRCVKCGQSHKTSDCEKKDRNSPAHCALCNGPHPANYKGCEVYKEILARKTTKNMPKTSYIKNRPSESNRKKVVELSETVRSNEQAGIKATYADKLKSQNNDDSPDKTYPSTQANPTLEQLLIAQTEKFDLILQQMNTLMSLIVKLVDKLAK